MIELRSAKLFEGLPESELRSIEKQMKIVKHPAGHEIVVLGDGGVGFMIITAYTRFDMPRMYGLLIVSVGIAAGMNLMLEHLAGHFGHKKTTHR